VLPGPLRFVLAYLLATPVFWVLDLVFGLDIRIAFMEDTLWKSSHYSVLTASAIGCYLRPRWTAIIAFIESTTNVFIHILSFVIPVFSLPAQVLNGETTMTQFSTGNIIGFVMVGGIMALSFNSAIEAMRQ